MRTPAQIHRIDPVFRGYLTGHSLAAVAILLLGMLDAQSHGPHMEQVPFWSGYAVFAFACVFQLVAMLGGFAPRAVMRWSVVPELVAVALLVVGMHSELDVSFAVAVSLPMFYIAAWREDATWVIGGMFAAAYMAGHVAATMMGMQHDPGDWLAITVKASAIVYLGFAFAVVVKGQADREHETLRTGVQIEQLNYRLQRRLTELHAVSEITEIIHSSLDFDAVGPVVIDILQKVMDLPSCSLFVIDKSKAETLFSASKGVAKAELAVLQGGGQMVATSRTGADIHFQCTSVFEHNTMMVVFCAEAGAVDKMTEEDRLVLSAVASELVVAVENSQLYKLTRRLAITDELTGLYNYRYLQQRLDEEIERARRYEKTLSFVMLDLDDFKTINDAHGHMAGDELLAELGGVLRGCVREVDVVARYGGEEFSVILPETDAEGAYVVAEKIREAVERHKFADADGERTVRITVSIGLATYPTHARDKEEVLRLADDALYTAKHSGKDRVRSPQRAESLEGLGDGKEGET